jgi:predicted metal-dependent HD superfamily phosphohydrolase
LELVSGVDSKLSSTQIRLALEQRKYIQQHWFDLCSSLNISEELCMKWWMRIACAYSEPQRFYHTLDHIHSLLLLFDQVKHLLTYPNLVELSIWFHDVVYFPEYVHGKNESQSAEISISFMIQAELGETERYIVETMILSTISHQLPKDKDSFSALKDLEYFLDMDLSILGFEFNIYKSYALGIYYEYGYLYTFEKYCSGRVKVLNNIQSRSLLYFTDWFQSKYLKNAQSNLEIEIKHLQEHRLL